MASKNIMIGYDLNKPGAQYTDLIAKIKSLADGYWHKLDSTWIIRTENTEVQVRDALMPHIDGNDELLTIDITGDSAAWTGFETTGSDWLKRYL